MKKRVLSAMVVCASGAIAATGASAGDVKWAASWTTAIQSAYIAPTVPQKATIPAYDQQPDLSFALPQATTKGAMDQTFRVIVKPDLWSPLVRIRLSNAFGTGPVTFGAAAVALQEYEANLVPNTTWGVTFGGKSSVTVQAGDQVFSDPVPLFFVAAAGLEAVKGRNLAVSFSVKGASGPASYHAAGFTTNYISPPGSGDVTRAPDGTAFPYTTTSFFFLSEVDVLAPASTAVVVAYGDSITDGLFSTLNGNGRWPNVLSRLLHDKLGDGVSVVNEAIAGNAVSGMFAGQSAQDRLDRDVLGVSGVSGIVWLEGINDISFLAATPAPVIAGYQNVVQRLHAAGLKAVGATVTSSYAPDGVVPSNSPLPVLLPASAARYNGPLVDGYRRQLNSFILTSGIFDATADFALATTDPKTGTFYAPFVPNSEGSAGDYLHPNRAGYQVMGEVAAQSVLSLIK